MADVPELSASARPVLRKGVRLRRDDARHRHVLLAPERIFELDEVSHDILMRCDGRSFEDILTDLSRVYDESRDVLARDVAAFLEDLIAKGLVVT